MQFRGSPLKTRSVIKSRVHCIYLFFLLQLGLKKHHYLPLAHKPTKSNLKRKAWLKWLIPTYMYNKRFFPQFLSGSGYLVTQTGAECLLLKSKVFIFLSYSFTDRFRLLDDLLIQMVLSLFGS